MEIALWITAFIASLSVLLWSAKHFTETAERIGLHFHISPFIIGVTIIALGTSLPEIATAISSVLQGHSEIVIGSVTGSNIANILLVLAVTAIIGKHLIVSKDIIKIDLPILLGSAILLLIMTLDGQFTYIDGIISLLALVTYILYNVKAHRRVDQKEMRDITKKKIAEKRRKREPLHIKYPIILLLTGALLYLSANYTVVSVVEISAILNIATEIVAISAVAIGTSLPELIVSVIAARQGKADLAIGNVTGSNIFNSLGVMGLPALFGNLQIPPEMLTFTIPAMLFVTILYVFVTMDKEISQWEGITLLLIYIAFIGKTFGLV